MSGTLTLDPSQLQAWQELNDLKSKLAAKSFLPWMVPNIKGIYLWGGVGRGKTYLLDLFFEQLPEKKKLRLHFYRFMQQVHQHLQEFSKQSDPLELVAKQFAKQARVICFDEFMVHDIADAMLLGSLLQFLLENKVTLVMTSNLRPDNLYANGLQRSQFLPAIDLLNDNLQVINVDHGIDYRMQMLRQFDLYHYPNEKSAEDKLKDFFVQLVPTGISYNIAIKINQRLIKTMAVADDIIWFDFQEICQGYYSAVDYIEIACCYHTVLISNIPQMTEAMDDAARRFINLIDTLYDHKVKLLVTAEVAPGQLYLGGNLAFEFKRTVSRLLEMQAEEYLSVAHEISRGI